MVTAKQLPQVVDGRIRLPDIPERNPDEVTTYDSLHHDGNAFHLRQHLIGQGADPDRLLVTADHWIVQDAEDFQRRRRYPDLMVAFDVDLEAHRASNGYIIAEQGKPPDFVLEIASQSTGRIDVGPKRDDYEAFGIREYWRFDETGAFHGARLAGDRLVEGRYEPVEIAEHDDGSLRGYSAVLNVELQWQDGQLEWQDPQTGIRIANFLEERRGRLLAERQASTERARADAERARANAERDNRILADRQAEAERARAENAEEHLRRLEEEIRSLRGQ